MLNNQNVGNEKTKRRKFSGFKLRELQKKDKEISDIVSELQSKMKKKISHFTIYYLIALLK